MWTSTSEAISFLAHTNNQPEQNFRTITIFWDWTLWTDTSRIVVQLLCVSMWFVVCNEIVNKHCNEGISMKEIVGIHILIWSLYEYLKWYIILTKNKLWSHIVVTRHLNIRSQYMYKLYQCITWIQRSSIDLWNYICQKKKTEFYCTVATLGRL